MQLAIARAITDNIRTYEIFMSLHKINYINL